MSRPPYFSSDSAPVIPTDQASSSRHSLKPSGSSTRPITDRASSKMETQQITTALETPTRPFTVRRCLRRASQPMYSSQNAIKFAAGPSDGSDRNTNLYNNTSADSSAEDDSDNESAQWCTRHGHGASSLEYLDLPVSLPYSIVSLRTYLLTYLGELEARVRSFYNQEEATSSPESSIHSSPNLSVTASDHDGSDAEEGQADGHLAPFYAQINGLKDDLRRIAALLPSPSAAFPLPSPSAAFAARSQSLARDWERILSSLSFPLPLSSGFQVSMPKLPSASDAAKFRAELPSFPHLPSLPHLEMDLASMFEAFAAHLPSPALNTLTMIQGRFEALQESINTMTLRDYLIRSEIEGEDASLTKRFEATLADFSAKGRARANEVVSRVQEAEDKIYHMALEMARNGQALIRYDQLPKIWKNNEHILSGYRFIPIKNWTTLLKSTFQIHNETGNIHTHLWGLAAITPLFWPSKGLDEHTTPMDRLVQTLYLIAAAKCLTLSVSWHVMAGCSDHVWFERFACVDYTGIAWLVAASILTTVYNGFYCQPNLALFYSGTTLLVGLVGAILPWAKWFNDRDNKPIRIVVFLTMCFTGLLPFSHAAFEHGLGKTAAFFSPILPSLAFYIGGLVFYTLQFPESWAPGKFDVWGHSHQLWHIGIVLAIVFHYQAALTFHANRFDFSCALPNDYASPAYGGSSNWATMASFIPLSSIWSGATAGFSRAAAFVRPVDRVFEKAGGMEGIAGLARADEAVHHWRRVLGTLGGGAVGRGWDTLVNWAQSYW